MASIYKEGKTFTVAWFDSTGKRRYARGLPSRKLANAIAESKEFNKHAAKHGVLTPKAERAATEDERTLAKHLDEYVKALRGKQKTEKYIRETRANIERSFRTAGIRKLSHLDRLALVTACDSLIDEGLSRRSRNKAIQASRGFMNWLRRHDRIPENVLDREPALNVSEDRRRVRRALTTEQIIKLIEVTASQPDRGGMTGFDRMMRYALGIGTGFRQSTLFSLRPGDFHLEGKQPFIHVIATNTKNRKEHDQPIREDLAELLKPWLKDKPKSKAVFTKLAHAQPMIAYRHDLNAAGIDYHADGTVEFCDLHAQRNTFITAVIRAAGLKVAQDLAHHSTPDLTSKYGRMEYSDYAKGLAALPSLTPDKKSEVNRKNVG